MLIAGQLSFLVHLFVAVPSTKAVTSLTEGLRGEVIKEVLVYGFGSHRPLSNKTETTTVMTGCYVGRPYLEGLVYQRFEGTFAVTLSTRRRRQDFRLKCSYLSTKLCHG